MRDTVPRVSPLLLLLIVALLLQPHTANSLRILLTNNDGINDLGLQTLKAALRDAQHEVFVYAPLTAPIGPAAALTLPFVNVTEVGAQEFAVDGFPATCVLVGLTSVPDIDLVLSGPSSGFTSGGQDLHSGTLGAALTGISRDVPSFAILADEPDEGLEEYYGQVANFAVNLISTLEEDLPDFPRGVGLKIGYPPLPPNEILGVTLAGNNDFFPVTFDYVQNGEGQLEASITVTGETDNPSNDQLLLNSGLIAVLAIQSDISVKTTHYNGFFLGGLAIKLENMIVG